MRLAIAIIVTGIVITPYALVLLWIGLEWFDTRIKTVWVPAWLRPIAFAGGFLVYDVRRDPFWTYMMWLPAFSFTSIAAGIETAVCVLFLHLLTWVVVTATKKTIATL